MNDLVVYQEINMKFTTYTSTQKILVANIEVLQL